MSRAALCVDTERLLLRPFTLDDIAPIFAMSREDGMKRWIPDQVYADEQQTCEVLEYLIAQYDNDDAPAAAPLVLGVEERASGALVGHVGLSPYKGVVEIGYAIGDDYQGRGLATEAVGAATRWAVGELGLAEVWGIVDVDNLSSVRVLRKAGYALDRTEDDREFYCFR